MLAMKGLSELTTKLILENKNNAKTRRKTMVEVHELFAVHQGLVVRLHEHDGVLVRGQAGEGVGAEVLFVARPNRVRHPLLRSYAVDKVSRVSRVNRQGQLS